MDCHACGRRAALAPGAKPGFRETCEGCGADLHVCRSCAHHDPAAYNECREPKAERVLEKDRANRCDEFAVAEGGARPGAVGAEAARARGELERLFKK